jgi:hypothetical protein
LEWIIRDQEQFRAVRDGHKGEINFRDSSDGVEPEKLMNPKQFGSTDHSPSRISLVIGSAPIFGISWAWVAASPFGRRSRISMKAIGPVRP